MIRNSPFIRSEVCRARHPSKPIPCHESSCMGRCMVHDIISSLWVCTCFYLTPLKNTILLKFIHVTFFFTNYALTAMADTPRNRTQCKRPCPLCASFLCKKQEILRGMDGRVRGLVLFFERWLGNTPYH